MFHRIIKYWKEGRPVLQLNKQRVRGSQMYSVEFIVIARQAQQALIQLDAFHESLDIIAPNTYFGQQLGLLVADLENIYLTYAERSAWSRHRNYISKETKLELKAEGSRAKHVFDRLVQFVGDPQPRNIGDFYDLYKNNKESVLSTLYTNAIDTILKLTKMIDNVMIEIKDLPETP